MKIYTLYRPKPIPSRDCDWEAAWQDYEPGCPCGFGETEDEAVDSLLDSCVDEFETWHQDMYGYPVFDDDWPDRWDEWKSTLDIERIP